MVRSLPRPLRFSNIAPCDYYDRMSNDAREAWTLLFRLFVAQRGRVPQVAAEFELSPMQAHVLRLLEPGQPLPMRILARKLCCDASNVAGIVAIPIVTGVIGVWQTWQSNLIGQQVMHDLRAAVYTHLQRLSLAFFTRTRTGEVQSRIANDIGGIQNVVTTTATSITSNVTTVVATTVAMFALDWRLAAFSLALVPAFVGGSRRVGNR